MGRAVVLLGLTSMFTDVSSEMVATILPLYLVFGLGATPLQFGLIDGLYQGIAAVVRLAGGYLGDRWRRHKEVAVAGYGLSALSKLVFPLVGGALGGLSAAVVIDRIGKGIRTAPRDALISLSTPRDRLGAAFGVHRALDTAGALLGPLVAFGILAAAARAYDAVFVTSFCFAVIGVSILVLFVHNPAGMERTEPAERVSPRAVAGLLGNRSYRRVAVVGTLLALVTVSDGFVYLSLQRRLDFDETLLPLLYLGTAFVYMLLALPLGRVADRIGRRRVFLGGHVLLLGAYASLLVPGVGTASVLVVLLLLGGYYAATDGVLMAISSASVPSRMRGSGLALLVTATSLGRLLASICFGAVWTWAGVEAALAAFSAALLIMLAVAALVLRPGGQVVAA